MDQVLQVKVANEEVLTETLERIQKAFDVQPILDHASALLLSRIRQRFLAETDPEGRPWVRSYAAMIREQTGRGGGTLFDTGRLFHSIQLSGKGTDERTIGTDVPYAVDHQYGLKGNLVRRFMGISDEDAEMVESFIYARVVRILNSGTE